MSYLVTGQQQRSSINLIHGSHRLGKRQDADMARWRAYGLGQFIHWGVYSIPGGEWNGKFYPGAAEWIRTWKEMPINEYDNLYKRFDPKNFDPKAWAKQAKEMGAQYVIFTTKHHDGFCLWPTKYTSYSISSTPYKKDIVKQVVDAYSQVGIDVYLYFSVIDWNHPGYRVSLKTDEDRKAYEDFKTFTANQLKELLRLYPQAKGLWFDGTWDAAWVQQSAFADSLETELRAMHPGLIIGSRFRADENGRRHFDSNGDLIGDYEQGWERKLPKSIENVHGNDWDCVMTIPENQWGYCKKWFGHVKTSFELIEMIALTASFDGNFVLNFGPDSNGIIRSEENILAKEIGDWMRVNKEAIYNCGYAGMEKQDWGYITKNRNTGKYYLIIFNVPVSNNVKIKIPTGKTIGKLYDLNNNNMIYETEFISKDEKGADYFIRLKEKPDAPKVIILDMINKDNESALSTEKAKI